MIQTIIVRRTVLHYTAFRLFQKLPVTIRDVRELYRCNIFLNWAYSCVRYSLSFSPGSHLIIWSYADFLFLSLVFHIKKWNIHTVRRMQLHNNLGQIHLNWSCQSPVPVALCWCACVNIMPPMTSLCSITLKRVRFSSDSYCNNLTHS